MSKETIKTELKNLINEIEQSKILFIEEADKKIEHVRATLKFIEGDILSYTPTNVIHSELFTQIKDNNILPNYPANAKLLEKIKYFEDIHQHFWCEEEFVAFIIKHEAKTANETLKGLSQKMNYYMNNGYLKRAKYNDSRKHTFFSTNEEWIELLSNGKNKKAKIKRGFEPVKELLKDLSNDEMSYEKIKWNGLN